MTSPASNLPLHARIREQLRTEILEKFENGAKFTPEPVLIERFGVSQSTMRRALLDLVNEGLLVRQVPLGTFVRKSTASFRFLSVILARYDSSYKSVVLNQLADECEQKNLNLVIHHTHDNRGASQLLSSLDANPMETRFLLFGNDAATTRELCRGLYQRGFHAVTIDSGFAGQPYSHVGVDNEMGVRLAVEHLARLGHKRIALLVNEPQSIANVEIRLKAFRALSRHGGLRALRTVLCHTESGQSAFDHAYQHMEELWNLDPRPSAVISVSQTGALAALRWCQEREIHLPQELSVVSFDDYKENRYVHPQLTSVAQPLEEIASTAMRLILSTDTRQKILLAPKLVVRHSTRQWE